MTTKTLAKKVAPGGLVLDAIDSALDRCADAEYPFRAKLRSLSLEDWDAAWKGLMVDPDLVSTLATAMSDSAFATILALQAANPTNQELAAIKRHAAMKHATKQTWKGLLSLPWGGLL